MTLARPARGRALTVVAIVTGFWIAGARIASLVYWGYFLEPPSAAWIVSDFAWVDRFTSFHCCDATYPRSGRAALAEGVAMEWRGAGDAPVQNLPIALLNPALRPRSEQPIPDSLLKEVSEALDAAGALVPGEPGYKYAKTLWGHLAIGRDSRGAEIVAAALLAGEVSNDHHPYYEATLRRSAGGQLEVLRVRHLWWDYAGLEGLATFLGSLAGLVGGVIGAAAYGLGRELTVRRRRA